MSPRTLKAAQRQARAIEERLARAQLKIATLKAMQELKRDPEYRELTERQKKLRHELHQDRLNVPRHARRIATLERLLKKKREEHAAAEQRLRRNEEVETELASRVQSLVDKRVASAKSQG